MRIKKSPQADLNNKRSLFTLIGLVLALGFTYICFEWSKSEVTKAEEDEYIRDNEGEEEVDATTQEDEQQPEPEPEPEPQETPSQSTDIEVVSDDKETTGTVETSEGGEDTKIEIKAPTVTEEPEEDDDATPFIKVDKKASYPGGPGELKKYLSKNLSYPQIALDEHIQGTVILKFVVGKDGTIKKVEVLRSVDPSLDQEAIRVVQSMPKWTPAEQHNKPCASYFTLPVTFKLNQ